MMKTVVLVADDSATSRLAATRLFQAQGCAVDAVNGGVTALTAVTSRKEAHFDMILLDCNMPDIDGYTVAQQIRQHELHYGYGRVPIIALSGKEGAEHLQRCLTSGMDGVVEKPLSELIVRTLLARWCPQSIESKHSQIEEIVEQKEALRALFRKTSQEELSALQIAVQQSDINTLLLLVHRMRGAALAVRATAIAEVLERMETRALNPTMRASLSMEIAALEQQLAVF